MLRNHNLFSMPNQRHPIGPSRTCYAGLFPTIERSGGVLPAMMAAHPFVEVQDPAAKPRLRKLAIEGRTRRRIAGYTHRFSWPTGVAPSHEMLAR
jgi:hypothetical protein